MAKITRKAQKVFGDNGVATDFDQIGSAAAGSIVTSKDPDVIQALSNYLDGWSACVLANSSPVKEDMNALDFLITRQLAYLFQTGVPEWNATTVYYIGSIAQDGFGNLYISITDDNTGNALTSTGNWKALGATSSAFNPAVSSPYTILSTDSGKIFLVNSVNGSSQFNLPLTPFKDFYFRVKDVGGSFSQNACTIARAGSESIEGVAANMILEADGGEWEFRFDGTNWWITGR